MAGMKIFKPKVCRGMGMRRAEDVNTAFLCKVGWFLATCYDCLWVKVLKAKYVSHISFLCCHRKNSCSMQQKVSLAFDRLSPKVFVFVWKMEPLNFKKF